MRFQRGPITLLLLVTVVLIFYFVLRPAGQPLYGSSAALCPGPDEYGYVCESGAGYSYIDATTAVPLFEDDGTTPLTIPFPFQFYGTVYSEVLVSSNGTIQLGSNNGSFSNGCIAGAPAEEMGDLIAPYWDDLDLRLFGLLEFEVVGTTPNRIFVIEWDDVPRYGSETDDRVTFEVQLFEMTNDIVFLYEAVDTLNGYNGSSATIGIQSEFHGAALQYSCDQPVIANASGIRFKHPSEPNTGFGREVAQTASRLPKNVLSAKGRAGQLLSAIEMSGPAALTRLRTEWLNMPRSTASEWKWLDLNGNGRDELFFLSPGQIQYPELAQLILLSSGTGNTLELVLSADLNQRGIPATLFTISGVADVTRDGLPDILITDRVAGRMQVVTYAGETPQLLDVPERCTGSLALVDINDDDFQEIVRDGCPQPGRYSLTWTDGKFTPVDSGN